MAPKKAKKAVKKNAKPSASQIKAEKNVSLASIKHYLK